MEQFDEVHRQMLALQASRNRDQGAFTAGYVREIKDNNE